MHLIGLKQGIRFVQRGMPRHLGREETKLGEIGKFKEETLPLVLMVFCCCFLVFDKVLIRQS